MTVSWEARALSSDGIAAQYARVRPSWPAAVFDELTARVQLEGATPILEIGCGPGTFTRPLAERGYPVDALEPGPGMVAEARRALAAFPRVRVIQSRFEAFATQATYRLVVAASAFHWLDVMTRFQQCAALLEPEGWLAIYSAGCRRGPGTDAFWSAAESLYRSHVPSNRMWHGAIRSKRPGRYRIGASRLFDPIAHRIYQWEQAYSATEYIELLDTYPEHRALPLQRRQALYRGLSALIDGRFEGRLVQQFDGNLDLRRRKSGV